ncbi:MAG: Stp1/IreP family PP2C-type Ser/Thr phosphatase [Acidobacteriota bacterium]
MIRTFGVTHCGRVRKQNEDSLLIEPVQGLLVVCDGMGGHVGGEIAAGIATRTVAEFISNRKKDDWPFGRQEDLAEGADLLRNAIFLANQRITERGEAEPWLTRMGTTLVSALIAPDGSLHIANVGDSRAYLRHDRRFRQITSDHSWVNEQVQMGMMSETEAEHHPLRNVITRALGAQAFGGVDLVEEKLKTGDTLLLCTDGLTTMLADEIIAELVAKAGAEPEAICRDLVEAANQAGGEDNITVAVAVAD